MVGITPARIYNVDICRMAVKLPQLSAADALLARPYLIRGPARVAAAAFDLLVRGHCEPFLY
jgi:hypothetical protein